MTKNSLIQIVYRTFISMAAVVLIPALLTLSCSLNSKDKLSQDFIKKSANSQRKIDRNINELRAYLI